ncbi:hypothetical protein GS634_17715 [Ruegeria atlantica]|uniref:Uncharacterized protein n=1 Tax=Ruegeria atlantica TaxID=81569 RepID=A0AA90Z0Y5_9RHOB|nr:hypothetical protein [Ruegeria atlantica]NOE19965.1 hypothetical protein [Ruegeria atlantica]
MSEPSIPDWINAGSAAIGALAILIGLFGANAKINENRRTARQIRRSEVAEELIALSHNVEDAFAHIRNPMVSIPKDRLSDKKYAYQQRYERLASYNNLFKKLRDAQIRVRAVIGDREVDQAVEVLFRTRAQLATAIEILADYTDWEASELDQMEKDHRKKLRSDLYGSFSRSDDLGSKITEAVSVIENKLSPIARLE